MTWHHCQGRETPATPSSWVEGGPKTSLGQSPTLPGVCLSLGPAVGGKVRTLVLPAALGLCQAHVCRLSSGASLPCSMEAVQTGQELQSPLGRSVRNEPCLGVLKSYVQ